MWILITLVVILMFSWIWKQKKTNIKYPPAYSGGYPLIGETRLFMGDTIKLWTCIKELTHVSLKTGGVMSMKVGFRTFYIITDPDFMVIVNNECLDKDPLYKFATSWLGEGLLTATPSIWKVHRKLINLAFNQHVLDGFIDVLNDQSRKLIKNLCVEVGQGAFDALPYLRSTALETICVTAMGMDFSDINAISSEYIDAATKILNLMVVRFQRFWLHNPFIYRFSSLKREEDQYLKILKNVSNTVLQKKKANYLKTKASKTNDFNITKGQKFKPFMDLLLELYIDKKELNDREIREHIDTMIVAGEDTVANTILFTMLLIGSYPHVQERIMKEIYEIFGDDDRDVTKEELSQLVYLEAVLKESMRIYPTVALTARQTVSDIKLGDYTLAKGNSCFIIIYAIHRHPMWGSDAEEFKPERWFDAASLPKNANAFVAFSAGKRNCIGQTYAMMAMKITLVHIMRRYKIRGDHTKLVISLETVLKPHSGHFMTIENRN